MIAVLVVLPVLLFVMGRWFGDSWPAVLFFATI